MTDTYDKKPAPAPSEAALEEKKQTNKNSTKFFIPRDTGDLDISDFMAGITCLDWIIKRLYPHGATCPGCGISLTGGSIKSFRIGCRFTCPDCGHGFTARSGTILQGSQLSYSQVFLMAALIDLMQTGITSDRIAAMVGVTVDTVRNWIKKFKVLEGAHGK